MDEIISNSLKEYKPDVKLQNDTFKKLSEKYGTYHSLVKDTQLLFYFLSLKDKQPIRQKVILEHFKDKMKLITVRKHLYGLRDKGILVESEFKGSYSINIPNARSMLEDLDSLLPALLGNEVYILIKSLWESNRTSRTYPKY